MAVEALIIDDSETARRIIRHHLERMGCRVTGEAADPSMGLELFRQAKPQIVTLDLIIPSVRGIDAAQALRSMRKENPLAQIVVVSAMAFEKTRRMMTDEGALTYIIKPFNKFSFEQLRMRLQRFFPELAER